MSLWRRPHLHVYEHFALCSQNWHCCNSIVPAIMLVRILGKSRTCSCLKAHSAVAAATKASILVYFNIPLSACLKMTSCPLNTRLPPC